METKRQSRYKVVMYRFWIEYKQFFDGETTRRMRRRASMRRLRAFANSGMELIGSGRVDLIGIV